MGFAMQIVARNQHYGYEIYFVIVSGHVKVTASFLHAASLTCVTVACLIQAKVQQRHQESCTQTSFNKRPRVNLAEATNVRLHDVRSYSAEFLHGTRRQSIECLPCSFVFVVACHAPICANLSA